MGKYSAFINIDLKKTCKDLEKDKMSLMGQNNKDEILYQLKTQTITDHTMTQLYYILLINYTQFETQIAKWLLGQKMTVEIDYFQNFEIKGFLCLNKFSYNILVMDAREVRS